MSEPWPIRKILKWDQYAQGLDRSDPALGTWASHFAAGIVPRTVRWIDSYDSYKTRLNEARASRVLAILFHHTYSLPNLWDCFRSVDFTFDYFEKALAVTPGQPNAFWDSLIDTMHQSTVCDGIMQRHAKAFEDGLAQRSKVFNEVFPIAHQRISEQGRDLSAYRRERILEKARLPQKRRSVYDYPFFSGAGLDPARSG